MALSAIILTKNEERNIEKCIKSLRRFNITDIHVLDSFSSDRTQEIVKILGVSLYQRNFDNHLNQIKYALDICSFKNNYVLRIDADEELQFLSKDIISILEEISHTKKPNSTLAGAGTRSYAFLGRVMKYMPVSNVSTLRIVNHSHFSMNNRNIDESFTADYIVTDLFSIVDNCNKGFWHFLQKHILYGKKHGYELHKNRKNLLKNPNYKKYLQLPILIRPFTLFFYYYLLKGGYRDGYRGFLYLLVQTLVMRMVADCTYLHLKVRR